MVINDFNIVRAVVPDKAYTPLLVHANAALPLTVAAQGLKSIARQHSQSVESVGGAQNA